ncbi:MAG TPA: anthrone oxygenase family protein [Pseudonocardia sp.]|nr:anthrone oxygenase family protein [Pseudonocardia sp.]
MDVLEVATAVGAGLVAGVFFVFSVAIMPAFARLPPVHGVAVMQAINVTIVRAPFLVVFVGTAVACVGQVVLAPGDLLGVLGAVLYVVGGFGVTMVFNVPLNNRLDRLDAGADDPFWARYAGRWTAWNHVRTLASAAAAVALAAAA